MDERNPNVGDESVTIPQLHLARSLDRNGVPVELMDIFLRRCSATPADLDGFRAAGLVEEADGRVRLSARGRKTYKTQKQNRYF